MNQGERNEHPQNNLLVANQGDRVTVIILKAVSEIVLGWMFDSSVAPS